MNLLARGIGDEVAAGNKVIDRLGEKVRTWSISQLQRLRMLIQYSLTKSRMELLSMIVGCGELSDRCIGSKSSFHQAARMLSLMML
jgi:hypothetical protein